MVTYKQAPKSATLEWRFLKVSVDGWNQLAVSISVQFQSYSEPLNSRVNLRRSTLTSSGIPARMESSSEKCPGPQ